MAYKQLKLWFDVDLVEDLSHKISMVDPDFSKEAFQNFTLPKLSPLELKDRVEILADGLFMSYENDFLKGLGHFMQILGPENEKETGMFKDFYWIMPIAKYVEKYGLSHFDASMDAIKEITKRNTGEYTIRPFIEMDQKKSLEQMLVWSKDGNKHVRRLASEGVRPRLPWARKLELFIKDPTPIIPILDNLKDDTSKYVQKSVANCLNDILKDNPHIGKKVIYSWMKEQISKERKWILKHALRNKIKNKEEWAIELVSQLL